jgi:hypothetical protein
MDYTLMENSGRFKLPLIMPQQAQKHITHNEALMLIDGLFHLVIQSFGSVSPPSNAAVNTAYIVGSQAINDWFGEDGKIAFNTDVGWRFIAPRVGVIALNVATFRLMIFDQNTWQPLSSALDITTADLLGINTNADHINKLAVRSNAALFTAYYTNDGGTGNMQLKINKQLLANTASLLYQTGFSGRAEIGLSGDDDFHIKVSSDGSTWVEALVINKTTGMTKLANDSVGNTALANMPNGTFKARVAAGLGDPQDISGTVATTLLDVFSATNKGLAPASGGTASIFLRGDGVWAAPAFAPTVHTHGVSDIANFASSVDARIVNMLKAGLNTSLVYDTLAQTVTLNNTYNEPSPLRFYAFTDCLSAQNTSDWLFAVLGAGAAHSSVDYPDQNSIGALTSALGTVVGNRTAITSPTLNSLQLGQGVAKFVTRLRLNTLSTPTDSWTLRMGFINRLSGESVDGVLFRYTDAANGGRFEAVTLNLTTQTAVDTGIIAALNTTYKFVIDVNAQGTVAVFRINGAIVATISTNIPTASGREVGYGLLALRTAGIAPITTYTVDYVLADVTFTTPR